MQQYWNNLVCVSVSEDFTLFCLNERQNARKNKNIETFMIDIIISVNTKYDQIESSLVYHND